MLADAIDDIHARSRGTYGILRVKAALEIEQGLIVNTKDGFYTEAAEVRLGSSYAHEMFDTIGARALAERALVELQRTRTHPTVGIGVRPDVSRIADRAAWLPSGPPIQRLPAVHHRQTVDYQLRKVFQSRSLLQAPTLRVLPDEAGQLVW
jgi:hypothetical protein